MPIDPVTSHPVDEQRAARQALGACEAHARSPLSFAAVNVWRGPGAIAICVGHLGVVTEFFPVADLLPIILMVDLFFLFSGIVIAHAYTAKLGQASNIPEYVLRRVGRIWPVQAATLAILVGYELIKIAVEMLFHYQFKSSPFSSEGLNLVQAIPTNLLMLQSLGFHDRETWNFPSWSLSVEFVTYLVFAGLCLTSPMLRRCLSVIIISVSLTILAFAAPDGMRSTYDYGVFRCLAGFFTGTLCYEIAVRSRLPRWRFPTMVEVAALLLLVLWLRIAFVGVLAFAAPFVFSFFIFVFLSQRHGLLSKMLETRFFQVMAELSFSIYMVHAIVLIGFLTATHTIASVFHLDLFHMIRSPVPPRHGFSPMIEVIHLDFTSEIWALFAAYLLVVMLAAVVAYRFVEVPGRRAFARLAKRISMSSAAPRVDMRPEKRT